jgi:hypothetical protein
MRVIPTIVLGTSLLLAGCDPDPQSISTVCQALEAPILYNSYVLTSRRHAGPD